MRQLVAIVALIGLVAVAPDASAGLITFQIAGSRLTCDYGGGCDEFAEQTGLPPPTGDSLADFNVTFTLDTSAPVIGKLEDVPLLSDDFRGRIYSIDSPGTGLSIGVGALTLFSSRFLVAIGTHEEETGLYTNALRIYNWEVDYPQYYFELGRLSTSPFSTFSLNELLSPSLAEFRSMLFNPSGCSVRIAVEDSWTVCGGGMTIKRQSVPEPETVALFCLGLAGLGLVHRRRGSAASRSR